MGHAQPLGELVASSWGRVMIYLAVKQAKEPNVHAWDETVGPMGTGSLLRRVEVRARACLVYHVQ